MRSRPLSVHPSRPCALALAALVGGVLAAAPARATTYTWWSSGSTGSAGGTGNWDTSALRWTADGSTWSAWANATTDIAFFGGTAGTVTLTTGITTNGLIFDTTGYTVTGNTLTLAGSTPTITTNQNATVSSVVAGSAGLTKSGTATLTLTNVNTYSGGTVINQGTVIAGASPTWGASTFGTGTITINSGATLQANNVHLFGWNAGTWNNFVINDTGTFAIGANDNYIGSLSLTDNAGITGTGYIGLTAGTVSYTGNSSSKQGTIAAKINLQNPAGTAVTSTFTVNGTNPAGDLVLSGAIQQGGGVTKAGSGILTLSGNNTFTGTLTVAQGTVSVSTMNGASAAGPLGNSSNAVVLGSSGSTGTLLYTGATGTSNKTFTLTSGGTGGFNVSTASTALTLSGVIGGSGNFLKLGSGTLALSAANTFSGTTIVNGGYLSVTNTLRSTASVTVTSGTADLAATNIFVGGHGSAVSDTMVLTATGAGSTIILNSGVEARIGNVTLGSGGTLTSNRSLSSYDWLLANVTSGTWATVAVRGNAAATMNGTGGIHLSGVQNFDVADVTGNSNTDLTVSMTLGDGGTGSGSGGVNKSGAGTMKITTAASYTGATTINAGILELATPNYAKGLATSGVTVNAGAEFDVNGTNILYSGANYIPITANSGTIRLITGAGGHNHFGSLTLNAGTIYGQVTSPYGSEYSALDANITVGGSDTSTISGASSSYGYSVNVANLVFNVASTGAPSGVDLLVSSPLKGNSYIKDGAGLMRLTAAGSGAAPTIRAGTIVAANSSATGTSGTITLNDSSTGSSNTTLSIDATSGGVTISLPITVANQGTGTATLGSASTANNNGATFSGAVTLQKDVRLDGGSAGSRLTVSGGIGGTGNVSVVGTTRVVFLTNANTYSGSTTINAGAILQLSDNSSTATSLLPDGTVLTANGTLWFAKGNNSETIGGLAGSGNVAVQPSVTNSATLVVDGTQTLTFSGTIADGGQVGSSMAFTKSGTGTQVFTGNNTYTGATTITGGTLQIGSGGTTGSIPAGSAVSASAGTTLAFSRSDAVTYSGTVTGAGNLFQLGSGTVTLSGNNTYSGTTSLTAGVLALGSSGAIGSSGTITFGGGTLQYSASNTTDYSSRFSTASSQPFSIDTNGQGVTFGTALTSPGATLTKLGSGTLTLTANNTFSGATTVSAGVLRVGNGGATGSVAGPIANSGTVVFNRSGALSIGGIVSGGGALVQQGSGTTTLSGVNSYSGATTVTGGVLAVSTDSNLGAAPGSATPGSIVIDGGSLAFTSGFTLTTNRGIALGPTVGSGSGTIDVASGQTLIYGGVLANNGGTGSLVKAGAGTLQLSGAATYSGDTAVNAGTLQVGAGASLASPLVNVASGATLSGRGTVNAATIADGGILWPGVAGSGTLTTGSLTFSGSATVTMGVSGVLPTNLLNVAGDVTTQGTGTSVVFAFGVALANINTGTYSLLTYSGTLSDTSAFGYTGTKGGRQSVKVSGTTTAGAVSLVVGNSFPLWTGTNGNDWFASDNWKLNTDNAPTNFQNNDTVDFNDSATLASGTVVISGSNATSASVTFSANTKAYTLEATGGFGISTGAVVKSGSALVTITNANTYGGGTTLSLGRIRVGDNAALGTGEIQVTSPAALSSDGVNSRTLANRLHVDADVTLGDSTDTGALTFSGTVTFDGVTRTITTLSNVTLSGAVTNGGLTKSGSGVLAITGSNNYGGGTTLSAGTLRVGNDAALGTSGVTLNGGTLSSNDTNAHTLTAAFTLGGDVTLGDATNNGALTLGAGGISLGGSTRQVTTPSNVTFAGAVTNGGLTKLGGGTLTLSASNAYAAGTTLAAGALALGNTGALGSGTVTVSGNGTIRTALTGTIANTVSVDPAVTATFEATSWATTYAGVVGGSGAIAKSGAGTVVLTATNTYGGDTTISAGTLEVGGAGQLGGGSYAGAISNSGTLSITTSAAQTLSGSIANAGTIAVNSAANQTISGVVSGLGGLSKAGAGTLTLSNASNGFSGGSTITGGTVSFVSGALGSSGTVTVSGASLRWATGNTQDLSSRLVLVNSTTATLDTNGNDVTLASGFGASTTAALVKIGAGTLAINGTATYTGPTTVSAGVFQIGGNGLLGGGSYAGAITNSGTLSITTSAAQTISGSISGVGAVSKAGAGTLTLSGNNSFSGQLTVSQGTLSIPTINGAGADGTLGNSTSAVILGSSGSIGTLAYTGGNATSSKRFTLASSGSGGFDVVGGTTLTASGTIGGSGSLVKSGAGGLKLTTTGTYTGATIVDGGTFTVSTPNYVRFAPTSGVTVNAGATFEIVGTNVLYDNNIYIPITANSGTILLNASHNHFGSLTLNAATVRGVYSSTPFNSQYSTFDANVTVGGTARSTISGANSAFGYYLASTTRTFTVASTGDPSGIDLLVSSRFVDDSVAGLVKAGAGVMSMTGTNTYTGNTSIDAGTLAIGAGGQIYSGAFNGSAIVTVGSGATLDLQNWGYGLTSQSLGGLSAAAYSMVSNGGTIRISGATATSYGRGVTVNAGGVTLEAAVGANWTINVTNDSNAWAYNGNPTITLTGAGTGQFDKVLGNGTGGLAKSGSGTWTLTGVNTFSGNTTISAGTLVLGGAGQLGSGAYGGSITNDGAFQFSTSANQTLSGVISGAGSFTKSGAGTLTLSNGGNSFTSGVNLSAGILSFANGGLGSSGTVMMNGGTLQWATGNTQDISSRLALVNATTATLDTNGNAVTLASGLGAGTSAALTKAGGGSLALAAAAGYSGATTISGGTLALSGSGSLASSSGVNLSASGATLDISGASGNRTIAAFEGVAGAAVLLGGNTLTADNATSKSFGGVISGSGGFTKAGAGILTLTDIQTFTGGARIDAGTLAIGSTNALAAASQIFVADGATLDATAAGLNIRSGQLLGGYGLVDGNATTLSFASGATLSPGGSVGSLDGDFTNATLTGGMTYVFEVNVANGTAGGPNGWDLFTNTGAITLDASGANQILLQIASLDGSTSGTAANFDPTYNYAWKFLVAGSGNPITYQPNWFNVSATNFQNSHPGSFYVARGDELSSIGAPAGGTNELYVVYAAVPEPGTLALAGIGLAVAGWTAHRRRRRTARRKAA